MKADADEAASSALDVLRVAVHNAIGALSAVGNALLDTGAVREAGFALACARWVDHSFNAVFYGAAQPAIVVSGAEPAAPVAPAAAKCRHQFNQVTGICGLCHAERTRKPRTPKQPTLPGAS